MLTDHHCHLQDEKIRPHLKHVLKNAANHDITSFICCGTKIEDWQEVLGLHEQYDQIIPALGIHPWEVKHLSNDWEANLKKNLQDNPNCLVGEIGLDMQFVKDSIDRQQTVFKTQLQIARGFKRPVAVHNLKTWHLVIPILKDFKEVTIMLHSYSASLKITDQLLALPNIYFSFSGAILDHPKKALPEALNKIPHNRLLLETDSPYLLPKIDEVKNQAYNEPANMIFVLEKIAEIKKLDIDALKKQLAENSQRFLHHLATSDL